MPIAEPIALFARGEKDVGTAVVGMVNAFHPGIGYEDASDLVVGYLSQEVVNASVPPGSASEEEVGIGAELRVRIIPH